jgi:hypothetical protein
MGASRAGSTSAEPCQRGSACSWRVAGRACPPPVAAMATAILSSAAGRAAEPIEPDWHDAANSASALVSRVQTISAVRLRAGGDCRTGPAAGRIRLPKRSSAQPAVPM